ncbi:MAG: hypothetical protein J1F01_06950 [Oscillospiraceae bacterium]|nr:hypothetical protein [Oscillospiraceae bacterium]
MTKEKLEQYRSIVNEMDELRDRLNDNMVSDTVTGSDTQFPYIKHTISISGVVENEKNNADMRLYNALQIQKQMIDVFISNIEDSETRRIFRYRYIEGNSKPSWQWIAFKIGHHDEQYPRRKHNRFLKMINTTNMTKNAC